MGNLSSLLKRAAAGLLVAGSGVLPAYSTGCTRYINEDTIYRESAPVIGGRFTNKRIEIHVGKFNNHVGDTIGKYRVGPAGASVWGAIAIIGTGAGEVAEKNALAVSKFKLKRDLGEIVGEAFAKELRNAGCWVLKNNFVSLDELSVNGEILEWGADCYYGPLKPKSGWWSESGFGVKYDGKAHIKVRIVQNEETLWEKNYQRSYSFRVYSDTKITSEMFLLYKIMQEAVPDTVRELEKVNSRRFTGSKERRKMIEELKNLRENHSPIYVTIKPATRPYSSE